ncbi:MAG: hypothetical protein A2W25_07065 [candidate division Zixibacteria bacterium RBG_16_53_22]|nr:MAG: hypothetical protein A2W25_07065 [candidate division Zixibacteria bacterium RBG_16_53_22]
MNRRGGSRDKVIDYSPGMAILWRVAERVRGIAMKSAIPFFLICAIYPFNAIFPRTAIQGGDNINSATAITQLPFDSTGTTIGYIDDYDFDCPLASPGSPDVVYSYSPQFEAPVSVALCDADFDTKLYIFQNGPPNVIACSDDACGADGLKAAIFDVVLYPGNIYYFIIDGHGGAQGNYAFEISILPTQCDLQPPPNAVIEDEPTCYDNYNDISNAGCSTITWDTIQVNSIFFGTSGTFLYQGLETRDTDWMEFELDASQAIELEGMAEFDIMLMIIEQGSEQSPCDGFEILQWSTALACSALTIQAQLDAGRYWIWVGPSQFVGVECGAEYLFSLDALAPPCDYISGDINSDGFAGGIDVTYGIRYLKGGSAPPDSCNCPPIAFPFYAAGDVNGNCAFNGIDLTFFVGYLKGIQPTLRYCLDCPHAGMSSSPVPAVIPCQPPFLDEGGGSWQ